MGLFTKPSNFNSFIDHFITIIYYYLISLLSVAKTCGDAPTLQGQNRANSCGSMDLKTGVSIVYSPDFRFTYDLLLRSSPMPFSDPASDKLYIKSRLLTLIDNLSDDSLLILLKSAEKLPLKGNRKELRKICSIKTNVIAQDHEFICSVHDISYSGIFVETSKPISFGNELSLSFSIGDIKGSLKITGEVVRISPRGIGVKFKHLTKQQEEMIKSFVDTL